MAAPGQALQRVGPAPGLQHQVLRGHAGQGRFAQLVPAQHALAVAGQDGGQARVEIGLGGARFQAQGQPMLGIQLVAADVQAGIREDLGPLGHDGLQELVDGGLARVQAGLENAEAALRPVSALMRAGLAEERG